MKVAYFNNVLRIDTNEGHKPIYMRIRTADFYIEPENLQMLITKMQEALDLTLRGTIIDPTSKGSEKGE